MRNLFLTLSLFVCFVFFGCYEKSEQWDKPYVNDQVVIEEPVEEPDHPTYILPGDFPDLTKDDQTSNMCWAITTCNMLEYQGFVQDGRVCLENFRQDHGNLGWFTIMAFNHYFKHYLASDPRSFYIVEREKQVLGDFIFDELSVNRPVALTLDRIGGGSGHVVTIFGAEYFPEEDRYILHAVDGDDYYHTRFINVRWNATAGRWDIKDTSYKDFTLDSAISLRYVDKPGPWKPGM